MDTTFGDAIPGPAARAGAERYQPSMLAASGRIGRVRYFLYSCALAMAMMLVVCACFVLFAPGTAALALALSYLVFIPATFVLLIRRLNDLDRSGWFSLGAIIPFVNVALGLYASFASGSAGANRYGPAPEPNSRALVTAAIGMPAALVMLVLVAGMMGMKLSSLA